MKKSLIAIAALAATGAFAQSTVTIDGVVDAGYVNYDIKGAKVSGIDRNLTATSQFNFRVNSDLGGGMNASWRSETDFVVTSNGANQGTVGNVGGATVAGNANLTNGTASTFMNGEQELALSTSYGRVGFGAINNTALFTHLYSQPFGTAIGSGFNAVSGSLTTANVRDDNSFQYTTPTFLGGLKFNALVRKAQGQSASSGNANFNASLGAQQQAGSTSFAAQYNAGPLNALLTRNVKDATVVASPSAASATAAAGATLTYGTRGTYTALAANYKLGGATVYAGYQASAATDGVGATASDRKYMNVAVKYEMGANMFLANAGRLSKAGTATTSSSSSSLFALGYEYALSKTAALTARYERISDSAGAVSTTGYATTTGNNDRTRMGVGLRLSF